MTTPTLTHRGPSHDGRVGSDTAEAFLHRHPWVVGVGRVGWFAKGVVYALTGVLAMTVVADPFDVSGGEANQTGAIAKIAQQPFGELLLWAMAIGLFVYAAWRLVTIALPADTDGHAILKRVGYAVSAFVYVVLGITAISLARQPGSSGDATTEGEDSRIGTFTADLMSRSGGRWLVGLIGLVVIGIGVYFFVKAVTRKFEQELEHRSVGPFSWEAIRTMGFVGWIGRAAMMGLIGVFLVRAAVQFDPNEARGLDDSLRRVADHSFGVVLVFVVAVGLILYGAFCMITAPTQKLIATDDRTVAS
jgi:hypothetical protein